MWVLKKFPGFKDVAVKEYGEWLASNVSDDTFKAGFRQASDITLSDGFELEHNLSTSTGIKILNFSWARGSSLVLLEVS